MVNSTYKAIVEVLRREYGVFHLTENHDDSSHPQELINFFLNEKDVEKVLDVIELSFKYADVSARNDYYKNTYNASAQVDEAIAELNGRLKEHGIGFEFLNGELIRIDSQIIHAEAVKPALTLLSGRGYAGAQQEFMNAYEHYRQGKNKEALNDALKAFESTMKAICDKHKWSYAQTDTSKKLIEICFQKNLVPEFWQQHMGALRSLLESGIPTGRNKLSGHGQGAKPTSVPEHIVAYMLHMTASAIVFLVKSEQSL